jgi:hypothetical protein
MNIIKPSTLEEERIIPSEVPLDGLDLYGPFIETITLYALPDFPSILFPIHTDPFTRMVDRGDHSDNPVPSQRCRASDEDFVCSSTEIYMYRGTDNPNISIDVFLKLAKEVGVTVVLAGYLFQEHAGMDFRKLRSAYPNEWIDLDVHILPLSSLWGHLLYRSDGGEDLARQALGPLDLVPPEPRYAAVG